MPDVDRWSDRVVVALAQNPGAFTGPGTNTYLIGTGRRRILLDSGEGRAAYLPVLDAAIEQAGCEGIQEIVLTHGHEDHIGGVRSVIGRYGPLRVSKRLCDELDAPHALEIHAIDDGSVLRTDGATLRAIHAPGHAEDHLCFWLEEERSLFSGDNVLGVGTTVIPARGGDLRAYLDSLERMLALQPGAIYPAHGPRIADGTSRIREYIAHRREREAQILGALADGPLAIAEIVARIYRGYPQPLLPAAAESVISHLRKLEREGRVAVAAARDRSPLRWQLA
ncbi:MAG TPA: MBL fold metallo-hydrolase [Myxococcota bacterium]|nr:MBL fold metallo-hydrolase [Myxococcota bacterium]